MPFFKFFLYLSLLTAILFLIILLPLFISNSVFFKMGFYSLLSYYLLTLLAYFMSIRGMKSKQTGTFMQYVFGAMLAKLVLSFLLILLFFQMFRNQRMEFVFSFLIAYLLFTGFEIFCLMLNVKEKN